MIRELPPLGVDVWYAIHFERGYMSIWEAKRVADPVKYFAQLRIEYEGRGLVEVFSCACDYIEARARSTL